MRISDWSSDVCSSDLLGLVVVDEARPGREAEPQAVRVPQALGNRLVQQLRLHRLEQAGLLGAPQAPGIHRDEDVGWAIGPLALDALDKIGRASGRGRGCQYG